MTDFQMPSEALRLGRRHLEKLDFCNLLKDLEWDELIKKWILYCRLTIPVGSAWINKETDWYVLIDKEYPFGSICFHPAMKNSIEVTFPHQTYNAPSKDDSKPWRNGNICLQSPWKNLNRNDHAEPIDAYQRILWNFNRARDWLELASKNKLIVNDDPFELPDFPKNKEICLKTVVFSEDHDSFKKWEKISDNWGIIKLDEYKTIQDHIFVKSFLSAKEEELYQPNYGSALSSKAEKIDEGIWIKLDQVPVLEPWQVTNSWGELFSLLENQNINFKKLAIKLFKRFRDRREHFLLIGFPIPAKFNSPNTQIHWQPLKMPVLSCGNEKGFRKNEKSHHARDFEIVFKKKASLNWHYSENWSAEQISNRGRYPDPVRNFSSVLIGSGAIGSMFGELMVRSGIKFLTIIDNDELKVGNLVRHTLDINNIGKNKAEALSNRLNLVNPNSHVNAKNTLFSIESKDIKTILDECDLIIDCTASDSVINQLGNYNWKPNTIIASISIGMQASRLFIYLARASNFNADRFHEALKPWLSKQKEQFSEADMPWDGVGCWSPVYPARADDMWLMAAVASKVIVKQIEKEIKCDILMVFEQQLENGQFVGVRRIQ